MNQAPKIELTEATPNKEKEKAQKEKESSKRAEDFEMSIEKIKELIK